MITNKSLKTCAVFVVALAVVAPSFARTQHRHHTRHVYHMKRGSYANVLPSVYAISTFFRETTAERGVVESANIVDTQGTVNYINDHPELLNEIPGHVTADMLRFTKPEIMLTVGPAFPKGIPNKTKSGTWDSEPENLKEANFQKETLHILLRSYNEEAAYKKKM